MKLYKKCLLGLSAAAVVGLTGCGMDNGGGSAPSGAQLVYEGSDTGTANVPSV